MTEKKPEFNLRIHLDDGLAEGQYVNLLNVFHNAHEFVLDFGRFIPGKQEANIKSRLVTTPAQLKDMLRVLNHNLGVYERTFGVIQAPQPSGAPSPDEVH